MSRLDEEPIARHPVLVCDICGCHWTGGPIWFNKDDDPKMGVYLVDDCPTCGSTRRLEWPEVNP